MMLSLMLASPTASAVECGRVLTEAVKLLQPPDTTTLVAFGDADLLRKSVAGCTEIESEIDAALERDLDGTWQALLGNMRDFLHQTVQVLEYGLEHDLMQNIRRRVDYHIWFQTMLSVAEEGVNAEFEAGMRLMEENANEIMAKTGFTEEQFMKTVDLPGFGNDPEYAKTIEDGLQHVMGHKVENHQVFVLMKLEIASLRTLGDLWTLAQR